MKVLVMEVTIRVSFVNSLKEKRMILRSIRDRLKNNFNISIAEVDKNDNHKMIVLGIVAVSTDKSLLENTYEKIIDFIEANVDGELIDSYKEIENF